MDLAQQDNKLTKETAEAVVEQKKKKRGNSMDQVKASKEEISEILSRNLYWYRVGIGELKFGQPVMTDDECLDRIQTFFDRCINNGEIPTVEKLALSLGVTTQTLLNWERGGGGPRRGEIIKTAKQFMASLDAELAINNKMQPVLYIFRSKNFNGMRDQTDVVLAQNDPVGDKKSQEELAEKYDVIFDEEKK